jgi:hypothetical protein
MISICVPSRGRPEMAMTMLQSVIDTAEDYEVLFYLNSDDPLALQYVHPDYRQLARKTRVIKYYGDDQPTAKSWNFLAEKAKGDYIMLGSDDILFRTQDWDKRIQEDKDRVAVHSVNDGRSGEKKGSPHPIVTRAWYECLGYLCYPKFYHWYVDTWIESLSKELKAEIRHDDILIEHVTPKEGKNPIDDTFKRIRSGERKNWMEHDAHIWKTNQDIREQEREKLCECTLRELLGSSEAT